MSMSSFQDKFLYFFLKLGNDDISSCITLIINQSLTTAMHFSRQTENR